MLPKMMLRRKDHAEEEQEGSSPSHCPACALQEKTLTSFNSNIVIRMTRHSHANKMFFITIS